MPRHSVPRPAGTPPGNGNGNGKRNAYGLGACEIRTVLPDGSRNAQSRGP